MVSSLFESSVFTAIAGIREQSSVIQTSSERVSTGRRINRASDDVVNYIRSLRIQSTYEFLDARVVAARVANVPVSSAATALESLLRNLNAIRTNVVNAEASGNYALGSITHIQLTRATAASVDGAGAGDRNLLTSAVTVNLYVDGTNDITVTGASLGRVATAFFAAISGGTVATNLTAANVESIINSIKSDIDSVTLFLTHLTAGRAAIQAVEEASQRSSSTAKISYSELLKADIDYESARLSSSRTQRELAQRVIGLLNTNQTGILRIFG